METLTITETASPELSGNLRELPVNMIYPNPKQPRTVFDSEALQELSASILKSGLMQPITVACRPSGDGKGYMIIAGERRWRATCLAGLETISAIIRDVDDTILAELALILRRDLNVMEEAKAYGAFIERGYTVESLAKLLGHKSNSRVADRLSLLNLDASLQDGVSKGAIGATQALEMSRLSREGQFQLWRAIQDGKCQSTAKLRRLAAAMFDLENQEDLFQQKPLTDAERKSLGKVDAFIDVAGTLLGSIGAADLAVLETVPKADAGICIDRLLLLAKTCYQVANALQTCVAKVEATEFQDAA